MDMTYINKKDFPKQEGQRKEPACIARADLSHVEAITDMRVRQQVEHWSRTLERDFSIYAAQYREITETYLRRRLNHSLFYVVKFIGDELVAMCALEEQDELPPITVCMENKRHGWIVSVYTKPEHRGKGYQQALLRELLKLAKEKGFGDVTLTTNRPDAIRVFTGAGFRHVSDKYYLEL